MDAKEGDRPKKKRYILKTYPYDNRTPAQVRAEHRLVAMQYVERRYCRER